MKYCLACLCLLALTSACKKDGPSLEGAGDPVTAMIGPQGGELSVNAADGASLSMTFPRGALWVDTEVTLTPLASDDDSWLRVRMEPPGLKFRQPVAIVATPASAALGATTILSFGEGEDFVGLATTVDGAAATASTMRLGFAFEDEPADGPRRQALESGNLFNAGDKSCDELYASADAKFKSLVGQPGLFELAYGVYQLEQALIANEACDDQQYKLWEAIKENGCREYDRAVLLAQSTAPTGPGDFEAEIRPILHWASLTGLADGVDCAADIQTVLSALATQFVSYYAAKLAQPSNTTFADMRAEIRDLYASSGDLHAIGLQTVDNELTIRARWPATLRARQAAYALTKTNLDVNWLGRVTDAGMQLPRPILHVEPPAVQAVGLELGYPDDDVHADIQYALSTATFRSEDSGSQELGSLTLGGGETYDSGTGTGALPLVSDGEIIISGSILGFVCYAGGDDSKDDEGKLIALLDVIDFDAEDELVIAVNGTEIETLTKSEMRGNFLEFDVRVDVAEVMTALSTTFSASTVYELTVTRTRAMGETHQRYCNTDLLGPESYPLFVIGLGGEPAADFSVRAKLPGEAVEALRDSLTLASDQTADIYGVVRDGGQPASAQVVQFNIESGAGRLSASSASSNSQGHAKITYTPQDGECGLVSIGGSTTFGGGQSASLVIDVECPQSGTGEMVDVPATMVPDIGTVPAFKVMRFEAKANTMGVAAGLPTTNITFNAARTACAGRGMSLITETQWLALAHNIAQVAGNWSGGAVGSGGLPVGHGGLTATLLDGPANVNDARDGRAHVLSNGEIIWDLSGNAAEWVYFDSTPGAGLDGLLNTGVYTGAGNTGIVGAALETATNAAVVPPYETTSAGWMFTVDVAARTMVRGGSCCAGSFTPGVFSIHTGTDRVDDSSATNIGFRCTQ